MEVDNLVPWTALTSLKSAANGRGRMPAKQNFITRKPGRGASVRQPWRTHVLHADAKQRLTYRQRPLLPQLPPPTNTIEHAGRVVDAAWPLVCAAKGRTFFLCTSLVAVSKAAEELRALLDHAGNPYPLFVQGDMPKAALIDAFREHGNAILVGSMSFWECSKDIDNL